MASSCVADWFKRHYKVNFREAPDSDFPDPLFRCWGDKIQTWRWKNSASQAAYSKNSFLYWGGKKKSAKWIIFLQFNSPLCELDKDYGNCSYNTSVLDIFDSIWGQTEVEMRRTVSISGFTCASGLIPALIPPVCKLLLWQLVTLCPISFHLQEIRLQESSCCPPAGLFDKYKVQHIYFPVLKPEQKKISAPQRWHDSSAGTSCRSHHSVTLKAF